MRGVCARVYRPHDAPLLCGVGCGLRDESVTGRSFWLLLQPQLSERHRAAQSGQPSAQSTDLTSQRLVAADVKLGHWVKEPCGRYDQLNPPPNILEHAKFARESTRICVNQVAQLRGHQNAAGDPSTQKPHRVYNTSTPNATQRPLKWEKPSAAPVLHLIAAPQRLCKNQQ